MKKSDITLKLKNLLHIPIDSGTYRRIIKIAKAENRTLANVGRNLLWESLERRNEV